MAHVQLENISRRYGATQAVETVSMEVKPGTFLTLLGPSGCGKTTTLRMVAGLVAPSTGIVRIDGRDVTALGAAERGIGMVFQSLALFPHMTVAQNVAFGLKMRRVAPGLASKRVQDMLAVVRLDHLAARYPNQLSGGQQQRVALARALVIEPSILILDEPFGALDRKLREAMQVELRQITQHLKITALFVTHDQEEALMLSDVIAVMNQGRIEQMGSPHEVFQNPRTRFVADFMGVTNFLAARWSGGRCLVGDIALPAGPMLPSADGRSVELAIRPEEIVLQAGVVDGGLPGRVIQAVYHGTSTSYIVTLLEKQTITAREPNERGSGHKALRFAPGDAVTLTWQPGAVHHLES